MQVTLKSPNENVGSTERMQSFLGLAPKHARSWSCWSVASTHIRRLWSSCYNSNKFIFASYSVITLLNNHEE